MFRFHKKQLEFFNQPVNEKLVFYTGGYGGRIPISRDLYELLSIINKKENKMNVPNEQEAKEARFLSAGGKLPEKVAQVSPKVSTASDQHFSKILNNTTKNWWYGKDKNTHITGMHDKHLINTMKFLLTHANSIEQQWMYTWNNFNTTLLPGSLVNVCDDLWENVRKANNKVSKLTLMIPCFTNLAEEIVKRFGPRALMALYDGDGK